MYITRKPNVFEKILLFIGILVLIVGYGLIHRQISLDGFSSMTTLSIFSWLILVALIILTAVNENIKEELKQIIVLQLQEVRLMREEFKKGK